MEPPCYLPGLIPVVTDYRPLTHGQTRTVEMVTLAGCRRLESQVLQGCLDISMIVESAFDQLGDHILSGQLLGSNRLM
jgi:hypothetical protein